MFKLNPLAMAICAATMATVTTIGGCAGHKTLDSKIYRVDGPEGYNYYRVRIVSSSFLAVTDYETGWYPAYAIDAFLGKEGALSTVGTDAEEFMRTSVAEAQKKLLRRYLDAFDEPDEDLRKDKIAKAARDLRSIQVFPVPWQADDADNPVDALGFEDLGFNPLRNLVDHTANKKYVLVLSADPDAILNQIGAFAEEAETTAAVLEVLAAAVTGTARDDLSRARVEKPALALVAGELKKLADRKDIKQLSDLQAIITEAKTSVETLP